MGFIEKAIAKHGNKYDYSLVEYVAAKKKVKIICKIHGAFEQTADGHLNTLGCGKCSRKISYTNDEILLKFITVHGDLYDYSMVNYNGNIFNNVDIICKKHGVFYQSAKNHIRGSGCPKCLGRNLTRGEILDRLNSVHNNRYQYDKSVFGKAKDKIEIICTKHGSFFQTLDDHGHGRGCPVCKSSKGEMTVERFLKINSIIYERQKRFPDCRNPKTGKHLLFDFYLPELNMCIEYDGEHHYKKARYSKDSDALVNIQYRDSVKTKFCLNNNIVLHRIPYTKLNEIDSILYSALRIDIKNDSALSLL